MGALDAAECPPTFGTTPRMVQALIAGGRRAITEAVEGAEDSERNGERDLRAKKLTPKDAVVGMTYQMVLTSMGEPDQKKVFEKFYRGTGSRPGGTGLGLSIVQGIARAHHGEIDAENNPAGGATFTIRMPVETTARPA